MYSIRDKIIFLPDQLKQRLNSETKKIWHRWAMERATTRTTRSRPSLLHIDKHKRLWRSKASMVFVLLPRYYNWVKSNGDRDIKSVPSSSRTRTSSLPFQSWTRKDCDWNGNLDPIQELGDFKFIIREFHSSAIVITYNSIKKFVALFRFTFFFVNRRPLGLTRLEILLIPWKIQFSLGRQSKSFVCICTKQTSNGN